METKCKEYNEIILINIDGKLLIYPKSFDSPPFLNDMIRITLYEALQEVLIFKYDESYFYIQTGNLDIRGIKEFYTHPNVIELGIMNQIEKEYLHD